MTKWCKLIFGEVNIWRKKIHTNSLQYNIKADLCSIFVNYKVYINFNKTVVFLSNIFFILDHLVEYYAVNKIVNKQDIV